MITVGRKTELCEIAQRQGTDKWFYYSAFYHDLLSPIRQKVRKVFEIGIGSPDTMLDSLSRMRITTYKAGASLRTWRDYFPNAHVYGLDKNKKACEEASFDTDRIMLWHGDSTLIDPFAVACSIGLFDLIVDDGDHQKDSQTKTFNAFLPLLTRDGIYIMEDVGYLDHDERREFAASIHGAELHEFHNPKLGPHVAAVLVIRK